MLDFRLVDMLSTILYIKFEVKAIFKIIKFVKNEDFNIENAKI